MTSRSARRSPPRTLRALLLVACFSLVFAVLDAQGVHHQLDEACALVATLAALAAVLHLGATIVAGWLGRSEAPS